MIRDEKQPFSRLLPSTAIPLILFLLSFVWQAGYEMPLQDQDTGWHIRAGEWIMRHHRLPAQDPWSFTAGDTLWYNISWLFDVLLGILHQIGGLPLLFVLTAAAFSFIAALLAHQAQQRGAGFLSIVFIFPFCVLPIITQLALCRPNLASSFLLLAFLYFLKRDRKRASLKDLMWLPVLMAIWVNMHGGFLIVPFLFAAFLCEAAWEKDWIRVKRLTLAGVATALAILVNPYGWHIYEAVMRTMDSVITKHILEWRPVNFKTDVHYIFFLLLFIFAFNVRQTTATIAEKLFMLVAFILTLTSIRHGMILVIACAPILTANLTQLFYNGQFGERFRRKDSDFLNDMRKLKSRLMLMGLCVLSVFVMIIPSTGKLIAPHSDSLNLGKTPKRAIAFVEKNYPHMKWMNNYSTGGVLIYYQAPRTMLFIDGRAGTAYKEQVLKDDLAFYKSWGYSVKARHILEKYDINGLIIPNDMRIIRYLRTNPAWKRVYRDRYLSLFVKTSFQKEPR